MPIDPQILFKAVADAGGWVVCVSVLVALTTGFIRGWIVPGPIYKAAVTRAERAESRLERVSRIVARPAPVRDRTRE